MFKKKTAVTQKQICQLDSGRRTAPTLPMFVLFFEHKSIFHKGTEVLLETQLSVSLGLNSRNEAFLSEKKAAWCCAGSATVMEATAALRGNSVFQT